MRNPQSNSRRSSSSWSNGWCRPAYPIGRITSCSGTKDSAKRCQDSLSESEKTDDGKFQWMGRFGATVRRRFSAAVRQCGFPGSRRTPTNRRNCLRRMIIRLGQYHEILCTTGRDTCQITGPTISCIRTHKLIDQNVKNCYLTHGCAPAHHIPTYHPTHQIRRKGSRNGKAAQI